MSQSSTLFIGMDVHKESMLVTNNANEHHAAVVSLGTSGRSAAPVWCNPRQRYEAAKNRCA
jgi:hypothetical protein